MVLDCEHALQKYCCTSSCSSGNLPLRCAYSTLNSANFATLKKGQNLKPSLLVLSQSRQCFTQIYCCDTDKLCANHFTICADCEVPRAWFICAYHIVYLCLSHSLSKSQQTCEFRVHLINDTSPSSPQCTHNPL